MEMRYGAEHQREKGKCSGVPIDPPPTIRAQTQAESVKFREAPPKPRAEHIVAQAVEFISKPKPQAPSLDDRDEMRDRARSIMEETKKAPVQQYVPHRIDPPATVKITVAEGKTLTRRDVQNSVGLIELGIKRTQEGDTNGAIDALTCALKWIRKIHDNLPDDPRFSSRIKYLRT
jgi:hypothetical protein